MSSGGTCFLGNLAQGGAGQISCDTSNLVQTCQVSQFNRETHDFLCFLTISQLSPQISRFSAKSLLKPQVIPNTHGKKKYAIISWNLTLEATVYWSHKEKTAHFYAPVKVNSDPPPTPDKEGTWWGYRGFLSSNSVPTMSGICWFWDNGDC
jgi:hypothetical protein